VVVAVKNTISWDVMHVVWCKRLVVFWGFLFLSSASFCTYFIMVIGRTVPRNNCLRCLFIFILPLHVSALAGHLQAEYTIIFWPEDGQ
jgi:hypothetical protein